MKVYLAIGGIQYEGYDILGIYSTRELAEEKLKDYEENKYFYDWLSVDEWEIIDKENKE